MELTRRSFLYSGVGLIAVNSPLRSSQTGALTAGQIIDRIKGKVGIPWMSETVDKVIAGSADTPIKGIATTMMATLDVVQRAVTEGKNFVITHEPTFFSHLDATDALGQDATYQYKRDFIVKNNVVIFRFHDHWHRMSPDGIATGMARELGWEKNADAKARREFVFPATPLSQFAKDIQDRLKIRTIRVVGDPSLPVTRVLANWGYASFTPGTQAFNRPDVNLVVIGEAREWELVEYVQDQIAAGQKKALIILGHVPSEESGMKYCAEWLKTFVTEVPVTVVPAREPFWRP
jgi:putative NIF3 family GTP cyclohydrolase 1 type 2